MKLSNDSFDLYYKVEGRGTPLLLLHGFTGSHRTWEPYLEEWKDRFQLILVDIVGHNKSQAHPNIEFSEEPYTMETMSRGLIQLLDQLGINRTAVLGYSMGGRLALYFAVHAPGRVLGLALESASPGLKTKEEREARRKSDRALADKLLSFGVQNFINEWESIPLFESQKNLPEAVKGNIRFERLNQTAQGLAGSLIGMGTGVQPSLWEQLDQLEFPVFLIVGQKDFKFQELNQEMATAIKNSYLHIAPDSGHAVHVEHFHFFAKIVKDDFHNQLLDFVKGQA